MIVVDYTVEDYIKTIKCLERHKKREIEGVEKIFSLLEAGDENFNQNIKSALQNPHLRQEGELLDFLEISKENDYNRLKGKILDFQEEKSDELKSIKLTLKQITKILHLIEYSLLFYSPRFKKLITPYVFFEKYLKEQKCVFDLNADGMQEKATFALYVQFQEQDYLHELYSCCLEKQEQIVKKFNTDLRKFFNDISAIIHEANQINDEATSNRSMEELFVCVTSPYSFLETILELRAEIKEKFNGGLLLKTEKSKHGDKTKTLHHFISSASIKKLFSQRHEKDEAFLQFFPTANAF